MNPILSDHSPCIAQYSITLYTLNLTALCHVYFAKLLLLNYVLQSCVWLFLSPLIFIPQLLLQLVITALICTLNMYIYNCQLYKVLDTIYFPVGWMLRKWTAEWSTTVLTIIKMGGGKRKDGKEGEVQGDEMERKEKKRGKFTAPWMMWGWQCWSGLYGQGGSLFRCLYF